jgi:hypothetical protein
LPLLAGGWFWFGRSGQHTDADATLEVTDLPADAGGSAVEEPSPRAKPTPAVKSKLPPKPPRRPSSQKKSAKADDEPSGPSPLDNLDNLAPAPSAK